MFSLVKPESDPPAVIGERGCFAYLDEVLDLLTGTRDNLIPGTGSSHGCIFQHLGHVFATTGVQRREGWQLHLAWLWRQD